MSLSREIFSVENGITNSKESSMMTKNKIGRIIDKKRKEFSICRILYALERVNNTHIWRNIEHR